MTSLEKIRPLILAELAQQTPELCKSILAEHSGKPVNWADAKIESLKYAKQNIDAYDEMTWERKDTEQELWSCSHNIDYETGCPVGQYDVLTRMLNSYDEWLEMFDYVHSQEFDRIIEQLEEAIYPEEG